MVYGVIDKFNILIQGCVLVYVIIQIEVICCGVLGGFIFQSICGSEKGFKEFGVELVMFDEVWVVGVEFNCIVGENCFYFEIGQGLVFFVGVNFGVDQVIMEVCNYGLVWYYDLFFVNIVVGFIGLEYFYNDW